MNEIKRLIVGVMILLSLPTCVSALTVDRSYFLRSFEVEDGLSQSMVYCILQDRSGFMWFGTQDGLNRYDGHVFTVFKHDLSNPNSIGNDGIFSLIEHYDGSIWVGTGDGIYVYNPITDSFHRFEAQTWSGEKVEGVVRNLFTDPSGDVWITVSGKGVFEYSSHGDLRLYSVKNNQGDEVLNVRSTTMDSEGCLWIATYGYGLIRLDPRTATTRQFLLSNNPSVSNDVNDLLILNDHTMLVGTVSKGVQAFDLTDLVFRSYVETDQNGSTLFVRRLMLGNDGNLWIGTETGVYIYNPAGVGNMVNLHHEYNDPYSLSDNAVHSIYQDRDGGVWIGTFFGGVNYVGIYSSDMDKYYPTLDQNSLSGKCISEFCQDGEGYIWIGTEDAGLNRFDPLTKTFRSGFIPATNVHALMLRNGKLWIGTFADGLFVMDLKSLSVRSYTGTLLPNSLDSNHIYSIFCDSSDTVWIGTMSGLNRYNPLSDDFTRVLPGKINAQVNDIVQDSKGVLWFATMGNGLFGYDRLKNSWNHIPHTVLKENVTGTLVSCILEDSRQRLWVGTNGLGVSVYDREQQQFVNHLTTHEGLPNDVIYSLVEDNSGNIWGSTNKGLFMIGANNAITKYTHADGLLGDQFNYKSGFKAKDGRLYFGGIKGFVSFTPEGILHKRKKQSVAINSFQVYNREVVVGEGAKPLLTQAITQTRQIAIPYGISTFSLGFTSLNYALEGGDSYAYMLEGLDDDWVVLPKGNRVTYSNLPAGNYTFRVSTINNDGEVSQQGEARLKIVIKPPFYRTVWSYIFYVAALLATAGFVIYMVSRRIRRRNQSQIKALEDRKERELFNAKIAFFTNITHEIRTPLSLIKMPLDEVMRHLRRNDPDWDNMTIISNNADRLLKLVNQLLDFRRSETNALKANYVNTDIVELLNGIVKNFIPAATIKGIEIKTRWPSAQFYADVDTELLTKSFSNLLDNALHHANSHIGVEIVDRGERFAIKVINDGERIAPEYADKIFKPFFKIDEHSQGSGIGLAFAHSLVEAHNGLLSLADEHNGMTCFVIDLPVHQNQAFNMTDQSTETADTQSFDSGSEADAVDELLNADKRATILLVDDNEAFLNFVAGSLRSAYNVLRASNGSQALEMLDQNYVDILITDVAMPVMDGMELCCKVRESVRFSHIPIIMLTAKTSLQSKMEGLKSGTDEYIEKPFSVDFLVARIENMLENRRKLIESYKHSPAVALNTIATCSTDEKMLARLVEIIYQHIEQVDLDVDTLASEMNMSRASLYRKVKSISQLTPNDFIRVIRLKRAAELLAQKEYRINEIAYIVGFRSSSYFAKCFYKQFGVLPKDFEK